MTWVPDTLGGAGAEMIDGFAVLRVAGRFAAPVPLAETLLAGWLLAQAGIEAPAGPMTIAPVYEDGHIALTGGTLRGRARHVPFARNARHIVVLAAEAGAPTVALVAADGLAITQGTSLAGEPRDTVSFDGATALAIGPAPALDMPGLVRLGAAARAQQMAGALEHILDQSVQWSLDRVQFGRPIAKFQAVQHNLAALAGEVAAAGAAADAAAEAIAAAWDRRRGGRGRGGDRQAAGRRGSRDRRRDRPSGAWRDGLYLRALAASCDAAAVDVARGIRQRDALGHPARPNGGRARRRRAVAVHHPGFMTTGSE